jgi:coenzyme F420-0:L-glutamate ligase / coenzyme F420-1:gamma-L-glutamate ligase
MTKSHTPDKLELVAFPDFPQVRRGDGLPEIIRKCAHDNKVLFADHDVLVVAQKIVSKAEGQQRLLEEVVPSEEALCYAQKTGKDPRIVELILRESISVLRYSNNLLITENRLGLIMANAGIDQSNVENGCVLLLPEDPDRSAREIEFHLRQTCGARVGVIIADSIGRAWRNGTIGHAIGVAGIVALLDLRGTSDLYGRQLQVTEVAIADEIAAAASLLMGQAAEGKPVVLIRGFRHIDGRSSASVLLRRRENDLFR